MKCKICSSTCFKFSTAIVLKKHKAIFYTCSGCNFTFIDEPYWLEEAYKLPINEQDTGIIERNIYLSKKISSIIRFFFSVKHQFMDYAGGYGILVNLLRNKGYNFFWSDPFTQNLFARSYEYNKEQGKVDLLTGIEVIEHFLDPINDFDKMLQYSNNLFLSTQLLPKTIPLPESWWYYGLEHGQHISFYTSESLTILANRFKLHFVSNNRNLHMFSSKKIGSRSFNIALKVASLIDLI